jgi:hypothetical protein
MVLSPAFSGSSAAASMVLKIGGFFFLLSGWGIVLSAVALLGPLPAKGGFVAAGLVLEIAGLALVVRGHMALHGRNR